MGDVVNIVDPRASRQIEPLSTAYPGANTDPQWARLVPGISSTAIPSAEATAGKPVHSSHSTIHSLLSAIVAELRPKFLDRLSPATVTPALLDITFMIFVYAAVCWLILRVHLLSIHALTFSIYVLLFVIFSAEEKLYSEATNAVSEYCAVFRVSIWTALVMTLSFTSYWGHKSVAVFLAISAGTALITLTARKIRRAIRLDSGTSRNVLILGSGTRAQELAKAIQGNADSGRVVKGFVPEHHLRKVYGPSMLSRIAREQFIDELIITSDDLSVAQTAIERGRLSGLEVRIAPAICGFVPTGEFCESLGGIQVLKIHGQQHPNCALAIKRAVDFTLALGGLIVLMPVFLLIATLIACDSRGPVFYRAERIGRKGRKFSCCKFRTMVPEADGIKVSLRSQNQRSGAFFKIENDPRITRVGHLLRRYSLDELPQLWNVLVGDMSLVGPRPHPPDDVSLYDLQHLQRLDFVPGITGLWQVTARRDPSFERSVALDVEYIKSWNLVLDARILWRTIFAVLEGSGS